MGTAYFARILNTLTDVELDMPAAIGESSRRHIIAAIGYQARMLSEMVAWIRTGEQGQMPKPMMIDNADIALGVTLPSHALRYLFDHSEVHLNVEWRDLTDQDWDADVQDAAGRHVALRATPAIRARALWLSAIDLGAGGRFADMPADFVDALIRHCATEFRVGFNCTLLPSDRQEPIMVGESSDIRVMGRAVDLARWLSGRGARDVQIEGATLAERRLPDPIAAI
jgi:maleylpyruvate isomerase